MITLILFLVFIAVVGMTIVKVTGCMWKSEDK